MEDLGDQRAIAEGLGPDLAELIHRGDRYLATSERANRLGSVPPSDTDRASPAPGEVRRTPPDESRLERRVCDGRKHR